MLSKVYRTGLDNPRAIKMLLSIYVYYFRIQELSISKILHSTKFCLILLNNSFLFYNESWFYSVVFGWRELENSYFSQQGINSVFDLISKLESSQGLLSFLFSIFCNNFKVDRVANFSATAFITLVLISDLFLKAKNKECILPRHSCLSYEFLKIS